MIIAIFVLAILTLLLQFAAVFFGKDDLEGFAAISLLSLPIPAALAICSIVLFFLS